jgi:uncharacterized phage protein (TIGR01671 family)
MNVPKFRAFHTKERRMFEVTMLRWSAASPNVLDGMELVSLDDLHQIRDVNGDETIRNNYELMLFTSLHDKNGQEIYEGDIVKGHNEWNTYGDALQVVRYEDGTWNYSYALHEYTEHPERDWEVVGNIYDTPELLKKFGE